MNKATGTVVGRWSGIVILKGMRRESQLRFRGVIHGVDLLDLCFQFSLFIGKGRASQLLFTN